MDPDPPASAEERRDKISSIRAQLRQEPANVDLYARLGVELFGAGDYDAAADAYLQAVTLEPDRAAHYADYGVACACANRLPEALAACRHAVYLFPNDPIAHQFLGFTLCLSGLFDEGVEAYRRNLALGEDEAEARVWLASALRLGGRFEEARIVLEAAARAFPDDFGICLSLSLVYKKLARAEDAARLLHAARRLSAGEPAYNQACLALADGNVEASLDHLSTALANQEAPWIEARIDPDLELLHPNPRFQRMIKECD